MPQNLEVKIKLESFRDIKKVLNKIGADFTATLNQKDIYYKNSGGLLKLRVEKGIESLIHYNRDENSKNRWSNYKLLKFSAGNAEEFFRQIFEVETVVEKKRLLYMYNNTRIHLDNIKHLGNYLELETLVLNGQADAKKRFKEIADLLNLDLKNQIKKSNRDLMLGNRR
ncbi:MAG: CYTH domain-containing protein [Ignavibacteriaceae bacterium]|jgi:predicted adenylyl cyclase CyaB